MRTFRRLLPLLLSLAIVAQAAAEASAGVQAYNEPTYTRTANNNAFWFRWTAVTGTDENANTRYEWYLCFNTYHMYPNGSQVQEEFSSGTNGPGTTNCTNSLRSGPTPTMADYGAMPFNGTSTTLPDGHRYDLCASGFYRWPYIWKWDSSSVCPWTIIDRNRPSVGVTLAGGAAYLARASMPVAIGYQDATSPPWQGAGGTASNWVCVAQATCAPTGQPNAACSVPADPSSRTTSFACAATVAGDGRWYVCVVAADSAVPDNVSGPDQFAQATSNNANLSAAGCDDVVVDTVAPSVSATADATSVVAGQPVQFSATVTDATAGVGDPLDWDFGDGTAHGSGPSATHAFAQPGTYTVRAAVADRAGNQGSRSITVTVQAAQRGGTGGTGGGGSGTSGGGGSGTNNGGGSGGTGGGGSGTNGGGTGTPGSGGSGTSGGGGSGGTAPSGGAVASSPTGAASVTTAPAPAAIRRAGGGSARQLTAGRLRLLVPARFTLSAGARVLRLRGEAGAPGTVTLSLTRGTRRLARGTVRVARAGSFGVALRLPARLAPGRWTIEVSFRPKTGRAASARATIAVATARTARAAQALVGIPLRR